MEVLDFDSNVELSDRYTQDSLARGCYAPNGNLFVNSSGITECNARYLASTVDTVRQLYKGFIDKATYQKIESCAARGEFFIYSHIGHWFVNHQWHVTKMAKVSGFRYKLQNNELGLIVLVGSYYKELDFDGAHLKIECSPHYLLNKSAKFVQNQLDVLASLFLLEPECSGVAVHLAADLQGWSPDSGFNDSFVTRSRFKKNYDGITEMVLDDDWSGVSSRYGSKGIQTYTFGKPVSLQTCVYKKSVQAVAVDKVDYYQELWRSSCEDFEIDKDVWRVEFRFHHGVIRELGRSLKRSFESYADVYDYLTDIWRYALKRNRLELVKGVLHPVWQILLADFIVDNKGVRIYRVKKQDQSALCKNYSLIIGNMITVLARRGLDFKTAIAQFKRLSFYDDILSSYRSRGLSESDLKEQVEKGLALRRLIGCAA